MSTIVNGDIVVNGDIASGDSVISGGTLDTESGAIIESSNDRVIEKIYEQAKDQYVAATIIYAKPSGDLSIVDGYAYIDSECTKKFKTSELKEAFIKGSLVNLQGSYVAPFAFGIDDEEGIGAINCPIANPLDTTPDDGLSLTFITLSSIPDDE